MNYDLTRGPDRVKRVAQQVHENLNQAVGISSNNIVRAHLIAKIRLLRFFIDG